MLEINENYSADKPVIDKSQDRFQRFNFSERIAKTIINRQSEESIVFGIYGAWGEGKSSVINFIDSILKKDENIITIHLNPWRYNDEESLLFNFFEKIAKTLNKEINTNAEKFASFVKKHGGLTKIFGIDLDGVSKSIADTKLEEFKERVDGFLGECNKRLVIFIDDIDRLDKQEIAILFKLVKLTADFRNTIYILSFDEKMVSASIGERYGNGDAKAGENFLEKIIQVPLIIPKAYPQALLKFSFEKLNSVLKSNNINLSEEDSERFSFQFSNNIISRLETPRLAVRYNNSISFSLPMLYGNVNTCDLMLIEAVKIFYHDYYKFIKENPEFFLTDFKGDRENQTKVDKLKTQIDEIGRNLNSNQQENIIELLYDLFPQFKWRINKTEINRFKNNQWKKEKRICSIEYFDRYFSYEVFDGDISDVIFDQFINDLNHNDIDAIICEIDIIENKTSLTKFIEKVQYNANDLEWDDFKKLGLAICIKSEKLQNNPNLLLSGPSALNQGAYYIFNNLAKYKENNEIFDISYEFIEKSTSIDFIIELIRLYNKSKGRIEKLFNENEYKKFNISLIKKVLDSLGDGENIITKFPIKNRLILNTYYSINQTAAKKHVQDFLSISPKNYIDLLLVFCPLIYTSNSTIPFKGDLTFESQQEMKKFCSEKKIKNSLLKIFNERIIFSEKEIWDDENTELNLVRQFFYNYKNISLDNLK